MDGSDNEQHSDKKADVRDRSSQAVLPSILVSTVFHVAILLILSFIILGGGAKALTTTEFVISDTSPLNIVEMLAFEPEPQLTVESEQIPQDSPPVLENISVSVPAKLSVAEAVPMPVEPASLPTADKQTTVLASVSATAAALSIQKRVSDAGGRKGEVQFALAWKNVNDVDLHIVAPSGERISHLHRRSSCGGMLDVDMNVKGESTTPVENVRWIANAPWGRFTVIVNLFRIHRAPNATRVYRGSQFQLLAQLADESVIKNDVVNRRNQIAVFRFHYVSPTLPTTEREARLKRLELLQQEDESRAQPLLQEARKVAQPQLRDRLLNRIVMTFPHTDAAIEAMQLLGGNITKR